MSKYLYQLPGANIVFKNEYPINAFIPHAIVRWKKHKHKHVFLKDLTEKEERFAFNAAKERLLTKLLTE